MTGTRLLLCGPEAEMPGLSLIVSLGIGIHIVPNIYSFVNSGYFVNFSFSFSFVLCCFGWRGLRHWPVVRGIGLATKNKNFPLFVPFIIYLSIYLYFCLDGRVIGLDLIIGDFGEM